MNLQQNLLLLVFSLCAVYFSICARAQTKPKTFTAKNLPVYFELGGSSEILQSTTAGYLSKGEAKNWNASAGFSMWRNGKRIRRLVGFPLFLLEVTALYGKFKSSSGKGFGFTSYLATSL